MVEARGSRHARVRASVEAWPRKSLRALFHVPSGSLSRSCLSILGVFLGAFCQFFLGAVCRLRYFVITSLIGSPNQLNNFRKVLHGVGTHGRDSALGVRSSRNGASSQSLTPKPTLNRPHHGRVPIRVQVCDYRAVVGFPVHTQHTRAIRGLTCAMHVHARERMI